MSVNSLLCDNFMNFVGKYPLFACFVTLALVLRCDLCYTDGSFEKGDDLIRLSAVAPAEFDAIFDEMERSFPVCERRERTHARKLLDHPAYRLFHIEKDGKRMGFFALWLLSGFVFVEHFVIFSAYRNQGLGGQALTLLKAAHPALVLEAEPSDTELAARRLGFYARAGFLQNAYSYLQPAYRKGEPPVPLVLLSYPAPLADPAAVAAQIHRTVYGVS